jgi:hypothetical protein
MIVQEVTLVNPIEIICLYDEILQSSFTSKIDTDRKISFLGTNLKVYLTATLTAGEITELETIVTDHDGNKCNFISEQLNDYTQRIVDGSLFYSDFRANLIFDLVENIISQNTLEKISDAVNESMGLMCRGDWHQAHRILTDVNTNAHFTNARKTALLDDVKVYVNANYPTVLHIP